MSVAFLGWLIFSLTALAAAIAVALAEPFSAWLVRARARRLPARLEERLLEEWLAELAHIGTRAGRLAFAMRLTGARTRSLVSAIEASDAPDGLVGTYRKLHLGIPLETDLFTPGDSLPVFHTDLGPIGISICYDFYQGPELSRILALKGARLLVNPTGRSALPRAREHLEWVTLVRAHENLVAAATANRVGTSHGPPEWAGGSVIAATQFPGFPVTLAQAGGGASLSRPARNARYFSPFQMSRRLCWVASPSVKAS